MTASLVKFMVLRFIYIAGTKQQFEPVTCFISFLKGDLKFGNEVGLAMGILRFMNIRTDTGSATSDLIGYYGFALFLNPTSAD